MKSDRIKLDTTTESELESELDIKVKYTPVYSLLAATPPPLEASRGT